MRLVIEGSPRTKKNSQRIVRVGQRPALLQSRPYLAWEQAALLQLQAQHARAGRPTIDWNVNLRALIYRDRAAGDLGNYLAAVCDVLQASGVLIDDRQVTGFDGSRLLVDRQRPRVDIVLLPMNGRGEVAA